MNNIIEIKGLKKYFGDVKAVNGISFSVREGSIFAFLGLNGAGKSTTINIIASLLKKDEGSVIIAGNDIDRASDQVKKDIGIVFQSSILDKGLSVKDNLTVRAAFYGLYGERWKQRLNELAEMLDFGDLLSRKYGKLSGGQRRRIDIARALINKPKLLILDEPTTGLDPQTRRMVWQVMESLCAKDNMTVFLTTHYMEEANLADNVIIIDSGKIAAEGTPIELKNEYSGDYVKVYGERREELEGALVGYEYSFYQDCYKIKLAHSSDAKDFIIRNHNLIDDFEVIKGDMDDVFLNVTGKNLSEEVGK